MCVRLASKNQSAIKKKKSLEETECSRCLIKQWCRRFFRGLTLKSRVLFPEARGSHFQCLMWTTCSTKTQTEVVTKTNQWNVQNLYAPMWGCKSSYHTDPETAILVGMQGPIPLLQDQKNVWNPFKRIKTLHFFPALSSLFCSVSFPTPLTQLYLGSSPAVSSLLN